MKQQFYLLVIATFVLAPMQIRAQLPNGGTNIDVNNIDAHISSSVDLFWDFQNPKFEVPKGSGKHAIYTGTIWIGGLDAGSQIRLGGQTYRQTGMDFWPGPIDTAAGVATNYQDWDRCWKVTAADIQAHIQNYTTPNYIVPASIADWPGYDTTLGRVLAPFGDYNSNGIYDPENGDYPFIPGDMAVYSIFNDLGIHTETSCATLGLEIHRMTWGFDAPGNTDLNNSIFMRYEIKNFSSQDYTDFRISKWIDFDLGNAIDDYVGTDIGLDMIYVYNGDNDDETSSGYGLNPPAVGVYFLNHQLSTSMAYENVNNQPYGNPNACNDFMNYLHSTWIDNQPVTYGGDGRNPGNPVTTYMYPGITDPVYFPSFGQWSEFSAGNPPNDRRMLGGIGPITLNSQNMITFDVGYTYAQASSGGPLASVTELQNAVSGLRTMYDNGVLTAIPGLPLSATMFSVYPNPATDQITISSAIGQAREIRIRLMDTTGRSIYENTMHREDKHQIETKNLGKGIYFLVLSGDTFNEVKKIIVR